MEEVIKEEHRKIISTFQKGKSPGPDGFTLDFFLGFYNLIKEDILEVVMNKKSQEKC